MVRTLVIKDSQVLIDGRHVEASRIPDGIPPDGLTLSYSFVGVDLPVVTIGEQLFAVHADRLEPLDAAIDERIPKTRSDQRRKLEPANGWIVDFDRGEYYTFEGERLEAEDAVPRLLSQANALYLDELQHQNWRLFARLSKERELEREAESLARSVRTASTPEERAQRTRLLADKLDEAFELKQQNRRDEIAQFEAELEELKRRVDRRQDLKPDIIEDRLRRLTGEHH
jgi:hypothetical protein